MNVPDSVASTAAEMKPYTDIISGNGVKFRMVPIPSGKYMMGSPDSERGHKPDESPQHEVEIEPLWIGKYEVTWDEYEIFMATLDIEALKIIAKNLPKTIGWPMLWSAYQTLYRHDVWHG